MPVLRPCLQAYMCMDVNFCSVGAGAQRTYKHSVDVVPQGWPTEEYATTRTAHEQVQGLGLVDEGAPVPGHVNEDLHGQLPRRFVQGLQLLGDARNVLNGPPARHDGVAHVGRPQAQSHQVPHHVLVDDEKVARKDAPRVQVGRDGLKGLVVAQNLEAHGTWPTHTARRTSPRGETSPNQQRTWAVDAVGMGASSSELRTP